MKFITKIPTVLSGLQIQAHGDVKALGLMKKSKSGGNLNCVRKEGSREGRKDKMKRFTEMMTHIEWESFSWCSAA